MNMRRFVLLIISVIIQVALTPQRPVSLSIAPIAPTVRTFVDMKIVMTYTNITAQDVLLIIHQQREEWFVNGFLTYRLKACTIPPPTKVLLKPNEVYKETYMIYYNKNTEWNYWVIDNKRIKSNKALSDMSNYDKRKVEPVFLKAGKYRFRVEVRVSFNDSKAWVTLSSNTTSIKVQ
jgi:hypothetical protein